MNVHVRSMFWVTMCTFMLAAACHRNTPSTTPPQSADSAASRAAAKAQNSVDAPDAVGNAAENTEDDASPWDPKPPVHTFKPGAGGATVYKEAATIVAGDMHLEVRANSLKEPTVVQIKTRKPTDFDYPTPPGMLVGAASGTPRAAGFRPVARWYIPLMYTMKPGATLQVLSWHPLLHTWFNIGDAMVTSDGTHARFFTMVMGDVVLRKEPVKASGSDAIPCTGKNYRYHEQWPSSEHSAVGLSTEESRTSRLNAFRYLTDYRSCSGAASCVFKNEERFGAHGRHAVPGQSYLDEDYLMDPNAAAALRVLQYLVSEEWTDPFTGEPTEHVRVTEAFDSMIEHSKTSTHYQGRALDLTLSPVPPPGSRYRNAYYGRLARLAQCAGFDYVLYEDHFHVHASVLPTEIAVLVQGEDGRYGVLSGDLAAPERWSLEPYRWTDDALTPTAIAWTAWKTFEIRGKKGTPALILHRGLSQAQRAPQSEVPPLYENQLGSQQLRVVAGHLYLVHPDGRPQMGSGDDDHPAVHVPTPVQFPLSGWRVIDASFRPHPRTERAWKALHGILPDMVADNRTEPASDVAK